MLRYSARPACCRRSFGVLKRGCPRLHAGSTSPLNRGIRQFIAEYARDSGRVLERSNIRREGHPMTCSEWTAPTKGWTPQMPHRTVTSANC